MSPSLTTVVTLCLYFYICSPSVSVNVPSISFTDKPTGNAINAVESPNDSIQSSFADVPLDTWIRMQSNHSTNAIYLACTQPGAAPGVVIAAPSHQNPDYYYHWVRDAALTMDYVAKVYKKTQDKKWGRLLDHHGSSDLYR